MRLPSLYRPDFFRLGCRKFRKLTSYSRIQVYRKTPREVQLRFLPPTVGIVTRPFLHHLLSITSIVAFSLSSYVTFPPPICWQRVTSDSFEFGWRPFITYGFLSRDGVVVNVVGRGVAVRQWCGLIASDSSWETLENTIRDSCRCIGRLHIVNALWNIC